MLSDVFNAAFTVISAFSTGSSSDESLSCSSSSDDDDGELRSAALCTSTATKAVVGRQQIALQQDSLHDRQHKTLDDPLVRFRT